MDIYIDESGAFIVSPESNPRVSCVTGLVLPTRFAKQILEGFIVLRESWGYTEEVKGSHLNEAQVRQIIAFLQPFDPLVEICAVDTGNQGPDSIRIFKLAQAERIRGAVGPDYHPNLVREVHELADRLEALPDQLVLQLFAATVLIDEVLRNATLYYSQRLPADLGVFDWCVDAKDRKITHYERLWRTLMFPLLQTLSLEQPYARVEEFDYSHFDHFRSSRTEMPDHLRGQLGSDVSEPFVATDLAAVMKSFRFANSCDEPGLQLADCIASAFSRAMNDTLDESGWSDIGSLIVRKERGKLSVRLITLDVGTDAASPRLQSHQRFVVNQIRAKAKPMLVP